MTVVVYTTSDPISSVSGVLKSSSDHESRNVFTLKRFVGTLYITYPLRVPSSTYYLKGCMVFFFFLVGSFFDFFFYVSPS